ncbi:hypothetical protein ACFTXM_21890 [Streptomyces sp. NPDC056930]|uniref:hypothetical protein n=1 Tax=Streptomyces sp. NPDC056930 TaxID=3345967 RepID=UPI003625707B
MTTIAEEPATGITARAAGYVHAAAWILGLAAAWGATPEVGDTRAGITTLPLLLIWIAALGTALGRPPRRAVSETE